MLDIKNKLLFPKPQQNIPCLGMASPACRVRWLFLEYPLPASLQAWCSSRNGPGSLAWEWPSRWIWPKRTLTDHPSKTPASAERKNTNFEHGPRHREEHIHLKSPSFLITVYYSAIRFYCGWKEGSTGALITRNASFTHFYLCYYKNKLQRAPTASRIIDWN